MLRTIYTAIHVRMSECEDPEESGPLGKAVRELELAVGNHPNIIVVVHKQCQYQRWNVCFWHLWSQAIPWQRESIARNRHRARQEGGRGRGEGLGGFTCR